MSDPGLQPFSFRQQISKAELVEMTDSALKIGKIVILKVQASTGAAGGSAG